MMVQKIASQSGIDLKMLNIDTSSIESIRGVLSSASDEDLSRIAEQYAKNKKR